MYNMKRFLLSMALIITVSMSFAQSDSSKENEVDPPANTVKIPGYELYAKGMDEGSRMDWLVAKRTCECKGEGWRLPTIGELKVLYDYRDMFENFSKEYYWASDQNPYNGKYYNLSFLNGRADVENIKERNKVRCVWSPNKVKQ